MQLICAFDFAFAKDRFSHDAADMLSCAVTAQLICAFVFTFAKDRFSHDAADMLTASGNLF